MLYHSVIMLFAVAFMGLQTMAFVHQAEYSESDTHDCVLCEAPLPTEDVDIAPAPIVYSPLIMADMTFYDSLYISAPVTMPPGRAPPPRSPPYLQV